MNVVDQTLKAQLTQSFAPVLSQRRFVRLCVHGEAGVGKSWVLARWQENLPCRSLRLEAATFEQDLLAWLREQNQNEATTFKEAALVFAKLAPFVLLVDNAHQASLETQSKLEAFLKTIGNTPGLAVVVAQRLPLRGGKNLECPRLSLQDLQQVLREAHNQDMPNEASSAIETRSLGNPLFALAFLEHFKRTGCLWSDGARWHWRDAPPRSLPPKLEALFYQWANPKHEATLERVLLAKAFLGGDVGDAAWSEVTGLDAQDLQTIKTHWQQQGVLHNNGFAHPLMQEVFVQLGNETTRQDLARKALSILEAQQLEPNQDLIEAVGLESQERLDGYVRLGHWAKKRNDPEKAGRWLVLAAQHSTGEQQMQLALEAARLLRTHDLGEATRLAQLAAQHEPHRRDAVLLCAELLAQQGQLGHGLAVLGLLPQNEQESLAVWETQVRMQHAAQSSNHDLMQVWKNRPALHASASSELVLLVASTCGQQGEFATAFALLATLKSRDLSLYEHARFYEAEAMLHYLQSHSQNAATASEQALGLARGLNQPLYLCKLLRKHGIYLENVGCAGEALGHYREALSLLAAHGTRVDHAHAQATLAPLLVDYGQFEEAEGLYLQSLAVANANDNRLLRCDCRIGLALLYLDWDTPQSSTMARRHALAALEEANTFGNVQMQQAAHSTFAMCEAQFGDAAQALRHAELSMTEALVAGTLVRRGRGLYALGRAHEALGNKDLACQHLRHSEALHLEGGFALTANRFGLEADRLTGDTPRAQARLAWFENQGFLGGVALVRRYFPTLLSQNADDATPSTRPCLGFLGPTTIAVAQQSKAYRGSKRLELLAYLLESRLCGRPETPLLELLDALYPGVDETGAKAILKQLVYLLRNQLGTQAIISTVSGYALGAVDSDVEGFLQSSNPSLWRGVYLEGLGEGWQTEARTRILEHLEKVIVQLQPSNLQEALRLCEIWQRLEPYSRNAITTTLKILEALGDTRRKDKMQAAAATRLLEVGEVLEDRTLA